MAKLSFEKSVPGRGSCFLPDLDVPKTSLKTMQKRKAPLRLPEMAQSDISRHYTELAKKTYGVNDGFYPLGSCTMKYNPKINDELANLPGFSQIHPLQPLSTIQGALEAMVLAEKLIGEITGMDAMTFQPAAGAHGEFTGILLIKGYHHSRGDHKRTKIIVPDSAHGTNPATASMMGYEVINIPSDEFGCVNLEELRKAVGEDTAGLMLTNPNTVGIFEKQITEITRIVHEAGGLNYYDGANLNAVMGVVRPGDMGFDVVHLNLHKTFSTPHGGGGPGSGAVGCKEILRPFLPKDHPTQVGEEFRFMNSKESIGRVKAFYGNFLVSLRALTYVLTLGAEGIRASAQNAVLNANYLMQGLSKNYEMAYDGICMHEFVITLEKMKKEYGITAMDIAKSLLDYGIHPPTMYFPLIVKEALMVEPTETESRETLDHVIAIFNEIYERGIKNPESLREEPLRTPVRRLDEVGAARKPKLRFLFD